MFKWQSVFCSIIALLFVLLGSGCGTSSMPEPVESANVITQTESELIENLDDDEGMITIKISVGDKDFTAKFYDNETSRAVINNMPFTIDMSDFNGQEKVATLLETPPSSNTEKPETIHAGELYIWSGNNLVLFYTTFSNSYGGYVKLGTIENVTDLVSALGSGDVTITFSTL